MCGFALLLTGREASAQICLGRPSVDMARVNVAVRADRRLSGSGIGIGITGGAERMFAGVSATQLQFTDVDASARSVAAYMGWSVVPSVETLYICPLLQFTYGRGPDDILRNRHNDRSAIAGLGGLAMSGQIALTNGLSLIPYVNGGALLQQSRLVRNGTVRKSSELGGTASAGLSLLIQQAFAIQASARVPIGFSDDEFVYSLGVTMGFLRRSADR